MIHEPTTNDDPNLWKISTERPPIITVICILGFIVSAYWLVLFFLGILVVVDHYAILFIPFLTGMIGFGLYVGLWNMKKWAAIAIACLCVANLFFSLWTNTFSLFGFLFNIVTAFAALLQLPKMKEIAQTF